MKYERKTDPRFVPASILVCSSKCVALEIYNRLAELEDKIERGELVEVPKGAVVLTPEERAEEMRLCNEERKQVVKDVLLTMLDRMDRLTGCGVPYHVKKFINEIAAENGIELVKEDEA